MTIYPIDVTASGAVHLGNDIVCDGFYYDAKARVQSHVHDDHMDDFDSSKGFQRIFMSPGTRSLLISERNADLPMRDNIIPVPLGEPFAFADNRIVLMPNQHMLGAVQTLVELSDGTRLGYSGDFSWPISAESVIKVDALVVDSTYGSPHMKREYSQADVELRLSELVFKLLKRGPIDLVAHRGTLHRALQVFSGQVNCPVVGSKHVQKEVGVYREYGYCIDDIVPADAPEGKAALASDRYIRIHGTRDRKPVDAGNRSKIVLSAFMSRPDDPVLGYSETAYRVALSDHADFYGTLEYIAATGAKYVVTDNTRGGNAVSLALEIQSRLGVFARPSTNLASREWGM